MTGEPFEGMSYIYTGSIQSHNGRVGVASGIRKLSSLVWLVNIANHKEWGAAGIEPVLYEVLSSEIEPAPAHPAPSGRQPRPKPKVIHPTTLPVVGQLPSVALPFPVEPLLFFEEPSPRTPYTDPPVAPDAYKGPEDELVTDCINWLTRNGFRSAVVGQLNAKGSGTTVGYPDLSFRRSDWPRGFWVLVELKNFEGTLSDEQFILWEAGGSFVVRSVRELALVVAFCDARAEVMIAAERLAQKVSKSAIF